MSNSLAIAAVTATLRNLLNQVAQPLPFDPDPDADLVDAECTTRAPDRARKDEEKTQLNLFLYQTATNPALRNADMPQRTRPGEISPPPLALNLYYLLTAYGRGFDELLAQRVMGRAMSLLHDHAVLLPGEIELALPASDLGQQIDRVRIVPHTLGGEELSKLWSVFQTPYRLTTAYQVSVVLIDSARVTRAALPVLGREVGARATPVPAFPTLERLLLPSPVQPAARIGVTVPAIAGDQIRLLGHDLDGDQAQVRFSHPLLSAPNQINVAGPNATQIAVTLPAQPAAWPAGTYSVSARVIRAAPAKDNTTSALPLAIAPRLIGGLPGPYARNPQGEITVNLSVSPQILPGQRVSFFVGSREVPVKSPAAATSTLAITVDDLTPGNHMVRLRVDGVDSLVVDYSADPPSAFDNSQRITVT